MNALLHPSARKRNWMAIMERNTWQSFEEDEKINCSVCLLAVCKAACVKVHVLNITFYSVGGLDFCLGRTVGNQPLEFLRS